MNNRSRSTLFLIEQLIVIAVFALCAAACARILTAAYFSARDSRDLSNALNAAENGAEAYKATGGDVSKVAEVLGGIIDKTGGADAAIVYYDSAWTVCGEGSAKYRLLLKNGGALDDSAYLSAGELSVEKLTGEEIVAFTVAAREASE